MTGKSKLRRWTTGALLAAAVGIAAAGCVVVPYGDSGAYGYGYGPAVAVPAPGVVFAPDVVVGGQGYHRGWHGGWHRGGFRGGRHR